MEPLVDSFGRPHRYLRISVTDRCNLRCTYCMPPEGIEWLERESLLTYEEIERLVRLFARMGVTKLRITGGEPLVRRQLDLLISRLSVIPGIRSVGLTTNGLHLGTQAAALRQAGVTHLNVSLDSLKQQRFTEITHRDELDRVLSGIDAALEQGFVPLKLNMVVMGGVNDDELLDFVELTRHRPIDVRFIEFMPFRDNHWSAPRLMSYAAMKRRITERYTLEPVIHPGPPRVAKEFTIPGFRGRLGFITSMTEDFCAGCERVRLTAEGALKPCLHDAREVGLREALRGGASDAELASMIRQALLGKEWGHAPMEQLVQLENRTMIQIGG